MTRKLQDLMATHPDECGIAVIRISFVNYALVESGANSISIGDCGLFVHIELVGEVFPESALTLGHHTIPGVEAGLDSGDPFAIQSVLATARADPAVKSDPFVCVIVVVVCVERGRRPSSLTRRLCRAALFGYHFSDPNRLYCPDHRSCSS